MPHIRPIDGYLVDPAHAEAVVSPAYDAVSPALRREFADAHPRNYINTMRLMADFPPDAQPTVDELLAHNKANLDALLASGAFNRIERPCLFLYQLAAAGHTQTGVVCEVSVDEYAQGRLRKHENTRSDKEDLLAMYQQVVGVSSSPICLAYPHDDAIDSALAELTCARPVLDFVSGDGVAQRIWRIDDPAAQQRLQALFARIDITYLTDGHHRAAAGWRYAQMRRGGGGDGGGRGGDAGDRDAPYNQLLVALFSARQLNLLPFHRAVADLNGMSEAQLVAALQRDFEVQFIAGQSFTPSQHGEFGMLIGGGGGSESDDGNERKSRIESGGRWYRLRVRSGLVDATEPVDSLDVSILQNRILAPIFGIIDARGDPRLDYVSGASGRAGLHRKCADGWAACFACFPTSIDQLMKVADTGGLMPPKSTYFDPKARSGIFIREK